MTPAEQRDEVLDDILEAIFETEERRRSPDHATSDFEVCDHGVAFDEKAAAGLSASEVRRRWPRLWGPCPKGCGFSGIGYASFLHYVSGDW